MAPVALHIQLRYAEDQADFDLSLEGITVKISNAINGQSYSAKTDADGLAIFESITHGNYLVTANRNFTAEGYSQAPGITTRQDVSFNASASAALNADQTLPLILEPGQIRHLVFKQLYYAGSDIRVGAAFRDEFIEIYNNTNDTIYAESLYFSNTFANNSKVRDGGTPFAWSKPRACRPTKAIPARIIFIRAISL